MTTYRGDHQADQDVEFIPDPAAALPPPPPGVEREPTRRWRFMPRSLSGRIVGGVLVVVALLVAGVGVATYEALHSFLANRLDQQVQSVAQQNADALLNPPNPGMLVAPQQLWAAVWSLDPALRVLVPPDVYGPDLAPLHLTDAQRAELTHNPGSVITVHQDGATLRVSSSHQIASTTTSGDVELQQRVPVVFAVGLSTSEMDRTLHRLVLTEWIIGISALLVAFAATYGGVQYGLRRLRGVSATAHEVARELSPEGAGLDRRVPVDESDTTEVGQLATSMNTLLAAVETQFAARLESEARLRQFLADASHELRTPLTSIRGYAELARMQKAAGETSDDNLARIESEGTRMSRLVEDLLMLARSDQDESVPRRELVDVADLLDDVASTSRAAFPDRPIETKPESGLHVLGDPDQLLRAVRNLVANAAIYTAAGRPVLIRSVRDENEAVIQVVDGGPGLPPEQAAHVFERFWRADKARSRARGGSGLGLAIVASVVYSHGGTVRFDSSVETGSTVTIRLPAV